MLSIRLPRSNAIIDVRILKSRFLFFDGSGAGRKTPETPVRGSMDVIDFFMMLIVKMFDQIYSISIVICICDKKINVRSKSFGALIFYFMQFYLKKRISFSSISGTSNE